MAHTGSAPVMIRLSSNTFQLAALPMLGCIVLSGWAAETPTPTQASSDYSAPATRQDLDAAVDAAQAQVAAVRAQSQVEPFALAEALTALGDALLDKGDDASAEAAYGEALQLAERRSSPRSANLLGPLRGMGYALAGSERHADAVLYLERAVATSRASRGVFDLSQSEILQQLAASLTALGRTTEAEGHMLYTLRVAEKAYGEGDPRVVPAFCDLGEWFSDTGRPREARMTFQVALNIVESSVGSNDLAAVPPLRGLAGTYMRGEPNAKSVRLPKVPDALANVNSAAGRFVARRTFHEYSEQALQRALQILDAHPQASRQTLIDTLIQMGDWFQIQKASQQALPYYQRAARLIAAEPSQTDAASQLGFPVRVYYPTPYMVSRNLALPPSEAEMHYVQVEYTVDADGSVSNARVVAHDTTDRYVGDILDAFRAARFRPKFVDGQPVATPALSHREVFRTASAERDQKVR